MFDFLEKNYTTISPEQGNTLMKDNKNVVLLDVRTPEEYKSGHIPKSINIPLQVLEEGLLKKNISKDSAIIVYCQSGMRASTASKILSKLGYSTVYNMGGIMNWPYEVVK